MSMRQVLADQIEQKLKRHGVVIWEDRDGQYQDIAHSVVPDDVRFEAFSGSWYELRRRIERGISGDQPPRLVLYTPATAEDDPLAEIREAGGSFKRRLATLVRRSLEGHLPPARIAEIAREARTLSEAEAAVEGTGQTDLRLGRALGIHKPIEILVAVLTGAKDDQLHQSNLWGAVAALANETVGSSIDQASNQVRSDLFQHLIFSDISRAIQEPLPETLPTPGVPLLQSHHQSVQDLLNRLRAAPQGSAAYRHLAVMADTRLALGDSIDWKPGLEEAHGTPAVEEVALEQSIHLLKQGRNEEALDIARRRLDISPFVSDPTSGWGGKWRTVQALAHLHAQLAKGPPLKERPGRILAWYTQEGWLVDRAHRRLEMAGTELVTFGELEDSLSTARLAYESWLDNLLNLFVTSVTEHSLDTGELVRQGTIHDRFVATSPGRTAYVWVDALRYELGIDLADALTHMAEKVEIHASVAAAPTITVVGMANLLPGAVSDLKLGLDGEQISVRVAGTRVSTVAHRRNLLRARHGRVRDLNLNEASRKGEKALGNAIDGADLILIRSQEVDSAGESGLLSVAWAHFDNVINLLANLIGRLAQCGVGRVVITADHGFISLSHKLGGQRVVDPPAGAVGTTKRRVFVGRGGSSSQATARIPLASCGVTSDLDLIVPRGLAVFGTGGERQFFHGGLSPQELIVPVIVVELAPAPEPQKLEVDVAFAGERITTGVFAATISFTANLFTSEVRVRVVAGASIGMTVARVVSGDGYDPDTGIVEVSTTRASVLTFQVIKNLDVDTTVRLQVLDAKTGRELAATTAPVSSPVVVHERLD